MSIQRIVVNSASNALNVPSTDQKDTSSVYTTIFYCIVSLHWYMRNKVLYYAAASNARRRLPCFHCTKEKKHPSAFFALHDTYWTDVDDVWWRNHYRQRINWLHFGRNCKRDKKAGYNRKFVATSNRYCHVTNDFTHFIVGTYVTLRPQGWRVHYTHAAGGIIWPCAIFSFSVSFYLDVIILDHYK